MASYKSNFPEYMRELHEDLNGTMHVPRNQYRPDLSFGPVSFFRNPQMTSNYIGKVMQRIITDISEHGLIVCPAEEKRLYALDPRGPSIYPFLSSEPEKGYSIFQAKEPTTDTEDPSEVELLLRVGAFQIPDKYVRQLDEIAKSTGNLERLSLFCSV